MAEDGEVLSSVLSSAAEGEEEDEGEERACKRLKLDEEQSLEEGDEWMTVVRGPKQGQIQMKEMKERRYLARKEREIESNPTTTTSSEKPRLLSL